MSSFDDLERTFGAMPPRLGVLLCKADAAKGRSEARPAQAARLLGDLAARRRLESIWASNAIAGFRVTKQRTERLIGMEKSQLRNQGEREVAGYRDAFDALILDEDPGPPTPELAIELHDRLYGHEISAGARRRGGDPSRAPSPRAKRLLRSLLRSYGQADEGEAAHPILLLAALSLDLHAIEPFAGGNERVALLLLDRELDRHDYGALRYVSLGRVICERRDAYKKALRKSREGWGRGEHSIWAWATFLTTALFSAHEEFEDRLALAQPPKGVNKQEWVRRWVLESAPEQFRFDEIRANLPGMSDKTIRNALHELRDQQAIWCKGGSGPNTAWHKSELAKEN